MAVSDDAVFIGTLVLAIFFTMEAVDFPLRAFSGPKVVTGTIWYHIRAMIFPFLAAATWFVMAAFAAVDTTLGSQSLYDLYLGLFFVFLVIGIVLTIYLAFRPLQETLEGKERLED